MTNIGTRSGKEVIQLYLHKRGGTVRHRAWEMVRFEKVMLEAGDTYHYSYEVSCEELRDVMNRELPESLVIRIGDTITEIELSYKEKMRC